MLRMRNLKRTMVGATIFFAFLIGSVAKADRERTLIEGRLVALGTIAPRLNSGQFELLSTEGETPITYDLIVDGPLRATVLINGQLNRATGAVIQIYGEASAESDSDTDHQSFLVLVPPGESVSDSIKIIEPAPLWWNLFSCKIN